MMGRRGGRRDEARRNGGMEATVVGEDEGQGRSRGEPCWGVAKERDGRASWRRRETRERERCEMGSLR